MPAHQQGPGLRVERRRHILNGAAIGKAGLVRQPDIDRHLVQIGQGQPVLTEVLSNLQDLLLAQIGDDVDRVELGDLGQRRLLAAAADDVAGVDQVLADDAVEGCANFGIAEIDLVDRHLGAGAQQRGFGARPLVVPVVDLGLGRRVLLDQGRVARELGLGIDQRGLRGQNLGMRLLQLLLIGVLLHREQQIALFDERAVLVMQLFEIALDPGDELDRVDRRGVAGDHDIVGDRLQPRQHHRNRRALRRGLRRRQAAVGRPRRRYPGLGGGGGSERPRPPQLRRTVAKCRDRRQRGPERDRRFAPAMAARRPGAGARRPKSADRGKNLHDTLTIPAVEPWR